MCTSVTLPLLLPGALAPAPLPHATTNTDSKPSVKRSVTCPLSIAHLTHYRQPVALGSSEWSHRDAALYC